MGLVYQRVLSAWEKLPRLRRVRYSVFSIDLLVQSLTTNDHEILLEQKLEIHRRRGRSPLYESFNRGFFRQQSV